MDCVEVTLDVGNLGKRFVAAHAWQTDVEMLS